MVDSPRLLQFVVAFLKISRAGNRGTFPRFLKIRTPIWPWLEERQGFFISAPLAMLPASRRGRHIPITWVSVKTLHSVCCRRVRWPKRISLQAIPIFARWLASLRLSNFYAMPAVLTTCLEMS
jgi:hypothetical protein